MAKNILYNEEARQVLKQGMNILNHAVGVTLGPKGKNVVLDNMSSFPQIVNDGITIAKEIELENKLENIGVALIRQAASKTNDVSGDGTTTATVLAYSIVDQGMRYIISGYNPILIKKGIEKSVNFIISKIAEYSRSIVNITDIMNVASISAGNDINIGNMIADAIKRIGKEGIISLEEGKSRYTNLEITEGMRFDKGFMSPYFLTKNSSMVIQQDNPFILITDNKITLVQQEVIPILEQVAKTGRSLLIIAEDIEKEALATLVINKLRGSVNVVAVRAPGFGDRKKLFLEDLAIVTGAQVVSSDVGLNLGSVSLNLMGTARRVIISKDNTTIISEQREKAVKLRCSQIRKQIEITSNNYEKEKLQERLSKLVGGVAIIKLGAATEVEMKNKKLHIEDAINATKAAIQEGIVPGGGSTLLHLSQDLDLWSSQNLYSEELIGAQILGKALSIPLKKIVENNGLSGSVMVERIRKTSFEMGYDVQQDKIVNMYISGIIDPAKVTRSALQNAASIASIVLTTECLIIDCLFKAEMK